MRRDSIEKIQRRRDRMEERQREEARQIREHYAYMSQNKRTGPDNPIDISKIPITPFKG